MSDRESQEIGPPGHGADVVELTGAELEAAVAQAPRPEHPGHDLRWLLVLRDGLGHVPYLLRIPNSSAHLPLALVRSPLFGRRLVSLPYINSAGVLEATGDESAALLERAVELGLRARAKLLELRQETALADPRLLTEAERKVHMRLTLPSEWELLWGGLKSKVRSQVKKGTEYELTAAWGREELLPEFYDVFSRNMRDLGTPVFGRSLFRAILRHFGDDAELCVVRRSEQAIAAGLLVHGRGVTEVPSASSLRSHNKTNANMVLYRHLLERAVLRGQRVFDFGRSSPGSGTYKFKEQWGAQPTPAVWQSIVWRGGAGDARADSGKFQLAIRVWRRLPLFLTRWAGPWIIRGIP